MKEQEIYKNILVKLISQTENKQINNTEDMMTKLIKELQSYRTVSHS